MFQWQRSNSAEFPRQKIYMTSLSQLMERKLTVQPEIEVSNKLFPTRNFAKKLSVSHQRIRSNMQLRTRKFDLHLNSKKAKDLIVENQRSPTSYPSQRIHRHQFTISKTSTQTQFRYSITLKDQLYNQFTLRLFQKLSMFISKLLKIDLTLPRKISLERVLTSKSRLL